MSEDQEPVPFYKRKDFLALRWKWYSKLKKDGKFVDIEFHAQDTGETLPTLNGMSAADLGKMRARWGESKVEYYRLAEQHKREVAKRWPRRSWQYKAWVMHAEGVGTKSIAKQVGHNNGTIVKLVKREAAMMLAGQKVDDVEGVL